jgi:hypothetical protein
MSAGTVPFNALNIESLRVIALFVQACKPYLSRLTRAHFHPIPPLR